ncbi:MAG: hypothetical protein PVG45_12365 [Gammaproteobacteria bacterium]|jgi:hypothetical protein
MNVPFIRVFRLVLAGIFAAMLNACSSTNVVNLEGSDSTTFTDYRASFPVSEDGYSDRIKIRLTQTSGEFGQDIAEGKKVDFEDFQLTGPDHIDSVTDITVASISYGVVGKVLREDFYMAASGGVSRTNFEIDMATESGQTTGVRNKSFEAYVDLGIYYEVLPFLSAGLEAAFSRNLTLSGITEWGVIAGFRPMKYMAIMGGYRWFKYDYFTPDHDSGIIVELNGPFVGLDFLF